MKKLNILVFFAVHGRHDILTICLHGLIALKAACKEKYNILPFAVCSSQADSDILTGWMIPHIIFENDPLGAKKNAGLEAAFKQYPNFEYMFEIGSDDIISPELLDLYEPYFKEKVHMISCNRCFFLELGTGKVATWTSDMIIGAGRCIHIDVLKRMFKVEFLFSTPIGGIDFDYRPRQLAWIPENSANVYEKFNFGKKTGNTSFVLWTHSKNRGMDTDSLHQCERSGTLNHVQIKTVHPLIIDIKSKENLNGFDKFDMLSLSPEQLLSHFNESLRNTILKQLPKVKSTRKRKKAQ